MIAKVYTGNGFTDLCDGFDSIVVFCVLMRIPQITLIFFFYGLSFFTMGVAILHEVGRCTDKRLRRALWFLGAFGIIHSANEWMEMFQGIGYLPTLNLISNEWNFLRLLMLGLSFLCLATFGVLLPFANESYRRLALLIPLSLAALWLFGLLIFWGKYTIVQGLWDVYDAWTRYILAIPGSLLACWGLIYQQREFRRAGMARFGRDSLWAAIAFAWYGLIGQGFTHPSLLPPSNVINSQLFLELFGFPIQLLRASAAVVAAVFVIRFLHAFEVEVQRKIEELQNARLEEAERREVLRGEMLRRVVAAQEAERQRIARELHDAAGQSLTAIGLGLRAVATNLRQSPDKASENLRRLEHMVDHSLDDLQRIISDLRPSHLDDLGLDAALRWYANEIQKHASIDVSVEMTGLPASISADMKTALFRIAQEALTNVVRHASADSAVIRMKFDEDAVTLQVEDNGCGFDVKTIFNAERTPWGLLGIEERASLLGGRMEISSHPGAGTRVKVVIPYGQIIKGEATSVDPVVTR